MCNPSYETDFAYDITKVMSKGSLLLYEGEYRGYSANDKFFDVLDTHFKGLDHLSEKLNQYHHSFFGIHDHWFAFEKL